MIKTVDGLKIGDYFIKNGSVYRIKSFPTRTSVIMEAEEIRSGESSTIKVPISELTKYYSVAKEAGKKAIKLKLTPEIRNFLQSGSMVSIPDGVNYFYMPFWFEIKDGEDMAIPHHMNNLPKPLREFLTKSRLGGDNPQPKQSNEIST